MKCGEFFESRRQAGQIERGPANERMPRCFRRRSEALFLQAGKQETVDGTVRSIGKLRWNLHRPRCELLKRPVTAPSSSIINPFLQKLLLLGRQLPLRSGRRHHFIWILRENPPHQLALTALPRQNSTLPILHRLRTPLQIQPQVGFPRLFIGAVTLEAVVGEEGENVAVKSDAFGSVASTR